jgi:hypothetical protein
VSAGLDRVGVRPLGGYSTEVGGPSCAKRPERVVPDGSAPGLIELGAVLAAVKDASRRLRRWPSAILDGTCARRPSGFGRGEETAFFDRTKKLAGGGGRRCAGVACAHWPGRSCLHAVTTGLRLWVLGGANGAGRSTVWGCWFPRRWGKSWFRREWTGYGPWARRNRVRRGRYAAIGAAAGCRAALSVA